MTTSNVKMAAINIGRYLIHNSGTELCLVSAALTTQKELAAALVRLLEGEDFDADDTLHILTVDKDGRMDITEFSSRFMEAAKFLARPDDPGWSEWDGTEREARKVVYG